MDIQAILSVKQGNAVEFIPEFKLSLGEEGLVLSARSPILGKFAQSTLGQTRSLRESGITPHNVWKNLPNPRVPLGGTPLRPYVWPDGALVVQGPNQGAIANLTWLYHPDLEEGFTLKLATMVPLNEVEEYFALACSGLRDIYLNCCRKAEFIANLREIFQGVR